MPEYYSAPQGMQGIRIILWQARMQVSGSECMGGYLLQLFF